MRKLRLKEDDEEIFGLLSFNFWTFTIIALFKYVFIVMFSDDNGEGAFRFLKSQSAILAVKLRKRLGFGMWEKLHIT
ncbi:hypothetical protein AAZX31_06G273500 [Glycine max]